VSVTLACPTRRIGDYRFLSKRARLSIIKIEELMAQDKRASEKAAIDKANIKILEQHREWYSSSLCGYCGEKTALFSGKCKSCGRSNTDWKNTGEFTLIKELKLEDHILEEHNRWYKEGKCGYCGGDVTLFTDKCKICERKRSQWKEDGEKDLREKLGN